MIAGITAIALGLLGGLYVDQAMGSAPPAAAAETGDEPPGTVAPADDAAAPGDPAEPTRAGDPAPVATQSDTPSPAASEPPASLQESPDKTAQPSAEPTQAAAQKQAVSALPRWTEGKYGDATHLMPLDGAANLHLGTAIVEGNKTSGLQVPNSGTATDNSDAGYDGLNGVYFADDQNQTPVDVVYASDAGRKLQAQVKVSGKESTTAYARGFIDFARDGQFTGADLSTTEMVPGGNGTATLEWTVPDSVASGDLPIRLRAAYNKAELGSATGVAASGEVEDYRGTLSGASEGSRNGLKVEASAKSGENVKPGSALAYEVWLKNTDKGASTEPVTITTELPEELENAKVTVEPTTGTARLSGSTLTWEVPAGVEGAAGLQISGVVANDAEGKLEAVASLSGLCEGENCESSDAIILQATPATFSVQVTGPASVEPGGPVQYKLRVTNDGETASTSAATVTNTLPSQIDLNAPLQLNAAYGSASRVGSTVTWRISAGLAPGATAELTIDARVATSAALGANLNNLVQITEGACIGNACSAQSGAVVAQTRARVALSMTGPTADVFPGTTQTYVYTVTNTGATPLSNVTVTEEAYVFQADPIVCDGSGTNVVPSLAIGASVTCRLQHRFTEAEFASGGAAWFLDGLTNTGRVVARDPDNTPVSANAETVTTFDLVTDMTMTKSIESMSPTPAVIGSTINYKVELNWGGDGGLWAVSFVDSRIPESGWTCTRPVTSTLSPPYSSVCRAQYTVTAQDISSNWDYGNILNRAAFTGSSSIWPFMNLTILRGAEAPIDKSKERVKLQGTLTADKTDAEPGDTVTFTSFVENVGALPATQAQVLDSLKGATEAPIPAANCTWSSGTTGLLPPGGSVTCTTTYLVQESDANSTIVDKVRAQAMDELTPVGPVDIGTVSVRVGSGVNLSATKANDLGPGARVVPGQQFKYTITLKNDGTAAATNVVFTDILPGSLDFYPAVQTGWTFSGSQAKSAPVTIPAKGSVDLELLVRVRDDARGGTVVRNVGSIDGMTPPTDCSADPTLPGCAVDPNPPTVDDSKILLVKTNSITKVPPTVKVGETFTYTIRATNTGVSDANGVVINDWLPTGLVFDPTPQTLWTFTGNTAKSASLNIQGGESVDLMLSVRVLPGASGVLKNVSAVESMATFAQCDADATTPGCGVDQNPPTVIDHSGVSLAKSNDVAHPDKKVRVGESFNYTIKATNSEARIAEDVLITDTLPTGLEFDGPQATYWEIRGNTATTSVDVPANGETSVTLRVRVAAGATGTLLNIAVMDDQVPSQCTGTPMPAGCAPDPDPPVVDNTRMSIVKANSVASGRVRVGEQYTYTFSVTNGGTETATGVVITDELQSDLEFFPATQTGWSATGQSVKSDGFDVTAGQTLSKSFTVRVRDTAVGETVLRNTGIIDGMATPAECAAQANTPGCGVDPRPPVVDGSAITIEKSNGLSGTPPQVREGETIRYSLIVRNSGTSTATNVRVTDVLPDGLEFYPTPQNGWSFAGQTATSTFGLTLASNEQQTLYISARVTPTATGTLQNVSAIDGTTPPAECAVDPTKPGCGVDPNPPEVIDHSGVRIEKANSLTGTPKTVRVGDSYTYTIKVRNDSAKPARQVLVSDSLPSGLDFDGPQATIWVIRGISASATLDLAPNEEVTLTLRVRVAPGATGTLRNVSVIDDQDPDQCTGTPLPVRCGVDPDPPSVDNTNLSITKTNSVGPGAKVKPGQAYNYTFVISNGGSEQATGVVVADTLPPSLEFESMTQPGWTLTGTTAMSDPQVVPPGGNVVLVLRVKVLANATGGTVIRNIGVIDGMATPNECDATPSKQGCAVDPDPPTVDDSQITITKSNDVSTTPKLVKRGEVFRYDLIVENTGTTPVLNLRVLDQLPAGLEFYPTPQSGWIIAGTTARSVGLYLDGGEQITLRLSVRVTPTATGVLRNVSAVEGGTSLTDCAADPALPGCGVDPDPPSVMDHSGVSITKVNNVQTIDRKVRVGDTFVYTIRATNSTATVADLVKIEDTLPAGLELDGAQNSVWTVTGNNKVSATVSVPANSYVEYDINVKVVPGARGTLLNVAVMDDRLASECLVDATLHGCGVDPNPPSVAAPLVKLAKSNSVGARQWVKVGEEFTYTISATNEGSFAISDVKMSDTLHDKLEFPSTTQFGWTFSGRTATTVAFDLAPGETKSFSLRVRVALNAPTGTILYNTAVQEGGPTPAQCNVTPTQNGCGVDPKPPVVDAEVIRIEKYSDIDPGQTVNIGDPVNYTITVQNNGLVDAIDVIATDALPNGLVFSPATQPGWTFSGRRADSAPFDVPAGTSVTLHLSTVAQNATADASRNFALITGYQLLQPFSGFSVNAGKTQVIDVDPGVSVSDCQRDPSLPQCAFADVTIEPEDPAKAEPTDAPTASAVPSAEPSQAPEASEPPAPSATPAPTDKPSEKAAQPEVAPSPQETTPAPTQSAAPAKASAKSNSNWFTALTQALGRLLR